MDVCDVAQFGIAMNSSDRNIHVHAFGKHIYEFLWDIYPGVQGEGQRVCVVSALIGFTEQLFQFMLPAAACKFTTLHHILANLWYY